VFNYNYFNNYFEKYNINKEDVIILLNYFEALALIGIEYLNNKEINDYLYD
jgi:hypothetical protein